MAQRSYFIHNLNGEGDSSEDVNVLDGRVPDGLQYHYENISVENEDSTNSNTTLGYIKSGVFFPLLPTLALPVGYRNGWINLDLVIPSGTQLYVSFGNTTNGDNLRISLQGFTWRSKERSK